MAQNGTQGQIALAPAFPLRGDYLRQLRKTREKNQAEVEDALDIPRNRLTLYERGQADACLEHVEGLARYFGVRPRDIVTQDSLVKLTGEMALVATLFGFQATFAEVQAAAGPQG
jgi:transcriptional regulator with XRE-family HTH domain